MTGGRRGRRPKNWWATNTTARLKAELWRRFGAAEHPAEWDGRVYGGGKLSQRHWEYFKAIKSLDLTAEAVVVDVGGGSPATGAGFFAALPATAVRRGVVFAPCVAADAAAPANVEFVREPATDETPAAFLAARPAVTHVVSVSVFKHVAPAGREGVVLAVDAAFRGGCFVATFEFHARRVHFERQLTALTVSALFAPLTRFYPDAVAAAPA